MERTLFLPNLIPAFFRCCNNDEVYDGHSSEKIKEIAKKREEYVGIKFYNVGINEKQMSISPPISRKKIDLHIIIH